MELYQHPEETADANFNQKKLFRYKEITAEEKIDRAPQYGRN